MNLLRLLWHGFVMLWAYHCHILSISESELLCDWWSVSLSWQWTPLGLMTRFWL